MITIKNISKSYKPKKGKIVDALKEVSLELESKGLVFLVGKSGSGKSTLMNLIGGLDHVDSGSIQAYNHEVTTFKQSEYDSYRNTHIGFIFQEFNLIETYTVYKNIALAVELQGKSPSREEIASLLKELELGDEIDRMPYELSGGQKQRVSIARALVKKPKILLADEPTGSLDSETGKQIFTILKRLSKDQLVIVVSHDKEYAKTYGDRIIELSDGRVINDSLQDKSLSKPSDTLELVKSKLPLKDAFILGLKSLGRKPFRMALTILLSMFAFSLFAITDTFASYNKNAVVINGLHAQDRKELILGRVIVNPFENYQDFANFNQMHFDALRETFPQYYMAKVLSSPYWYLEKVYNPNYSNEYYIDYFTGSVELTETFVTQMGYTLYGEYPKNENEMVISLHMFNNFKTFGYDDGGKVIINEVSDILGKTSGGRTIVGVLDTFFDEEKYALLLDSSTSWDHDFALRREMMQLKDGSVHSYMYVHEGFHEAYVASQSRDYIYVDHGSISLYTGTQGNQHHMNDYTTRIVDYNELYPISTLPASVTFKEGYNLTTLTDNQVLVPKLGIDDSFMSFYMNDFEDQKRDKANELIDVYAEAKFPQVESHMRDDYTDPTWQDFATHLKNNEISRYDYTYRRQNFYKEAGKTIALDYYELLEGYHTLSMQINGSINSLVRRYDVEIVGYYDGDNLAVSQTFFDQLIEDLGFYDYRQVIVKLSDSPKADLAFLNAVNRHEVIFDESTEIGFVLGYADNVITFFTFIILGVGAGLAVFAAVLLFNFISISIEHKKKDIGILRALGARKKDVFLIFLAEAMIMASIIFVLSSLVSYIAISIFDGYIMNNFMLSSSILWVGTRQIVLLFGVTTAISILSTWIPISRFAKQKPIDVIKTV